MSQVFPYSVILSHVSFICLFSLLFITCCSLWGSLGLSFYKFDLKVKIGNRNQRFCDYNKEEIVSQRLGGCGLTQALDKKLEIKTILPGYPFAGDVYKEKATWPSSWR